MSDSSQCPRCHAELPPDTPPGSCPKCLIELGAKSTGDDGPESEPTVASPGGAAPPPSPAELAPLFPQLEIEGLLGRGGMGAVYRARQRSLDRPVALKLLAVGDETDPSFAERFTREARALASLSHPSIVTVYDFGRAGERYFLLMELVDGTNLRDVIRGGELRPREALRVVSQICDALQFAHDEGVVHRDIKPENILLDRKGRVKIADFGLAKLLGAPTGGFRLTRTQQTMGTPHYMAPEQIERPLDVDHRADIYSLGVVFYELLTGELPLGRFDLPSRKIEVDVRVDDVVLRTLEKEPQRRYQHAADVRTDVQSILTVPGGASAADGAAPASDGATGGSAADPESAGGAATPPGSTAEAGGRPSLHALAITSLILSVLAFFLLPVVGSVGGIMTGRIALRDIAERPDRHRGREWARIGVVLGWIGLGLSALLFLLFFGAFVLVLPNLSLTG